MKSVRGRGRQVCWTLLAGLLLARSAGAAGSSATAPLRVAAVGISAAEAPAIDGKLEEEVWGRAARVDRFVQRDPQQGEPATEATEVRIVYTATAIYFGILCHDSRPDLIQASELRRDDRLENDDRFSILLDTFHDRRNAYLFRTNPLGTKFDALITDEQRQFNTDWDEKWEVAARITDQGWAAEVAIPFKSLRGPSGESLTWGLNLERVIVRKNEEAYWAGYSRDYEFWHVSQAGELTGLQEVRTGLKLRIKPYGVGGFSQIGQPEGRASRLENNSQAGLEIVKASLTPSITADFTLNPDFAQAEVDDARFNLTRFSLFFPEKREFFLERAGIFDFGTRRPEFGNRPPEVLGFFSRRVGLAEEEQIPITVGSRLTGDAGGFQFGFLNVLTREKEGLFPGDMSTVLRLKRKVLERSFVGAIWTDRRISASDAYNRLAGADANFVLFDKLTLRGYLAKTGGDQEAGDSLSYQASAEWRSDLLDFNAERLKVGADFDPQLGFVLRTEIVKHRARLVWKPRPATSWIRQLRISSEHVWFTNQRDFLESRENDIFFGLTLESGDFIGASYNSKYEALEEDFEIHPEVTIPAGSYGFNDWVVFARLYSGRRLSGNFRVQKGTFFGGNLLSGAISPLWKVNRNLSLEIDYNFNKASLPGGDFSAHVLNTRVNYNFTNRLLTSTSLQYNNISDTVQVNWRLNYIYRPGDDLFIVY
ncbi:MAG: DUF5916 domain-containing protein, partial [Acidobacteriota bacterium]